MAPGLLLMCVHAGLRQQISSWFGSGLASMEGYIRPGCVHLTVQAILHSGRQQEQQRGGEGSPAAAPAKEECASGGPSSAGSCCSGAGGSTASAEAQQQQDPQQPEHQAGPTVEGVLASMLDSGTQQVLPDK
jgi:hypothetical protein